VANLYRLWFSTPQMAGVTWWNLGDGTAFQNENQALGGLLDDQMNPKPAYRALDRLINLEWKTALTLHTDAAGKARFRGFLGRYMVQVTRGGVTRDFPFEVKRGTQPKSVTLRLP
jgi:endo-1,4-beta-xylanase